MANNRSGKSERSGRVKSSQETPAESAQLSAALDLLREILKNGTNHNRPWNTTAGLDSREARSWSSPRYGMVMLTLGWKQNEGFWQNQVAPWMKELEGLPVDKIMECPICAKLYYRSRVDKSPCQGRCANILRVRRARHEPAEQGRPAIRKLKTRAARPTWQPQWGSSMLSLSQGGDEMTTLPTMLG